MSYVNVSHAILGIGNRNKSTFQNARTKLFNLQLPTPKSTDWSVEVYDSKTSLVPNIDESYVFDNKELLMFIIGIERRDNMLFVGPTGSGKSTLPEQFAARTNRNCIRIGFDASISRGDLIGEWVPKNGSLEFQYGILPLAMRTPGTFIVLDEYDSISPENAFVLQRLLEKGSRSLFLPETNEVIEMHPDNVIIATANTNGQGDESGMYAGTRVQNMAQLNRFSLTFIKDYLAEDLEVKMLVGKYPSVVAEDANVIPRMVKFANAVRKAFKEGEIGMTFSTRDAINLLDLTTYLGGTHENLLLALEYCITNKMMPEDAEAVKGIFQRAMQVIETSDKKAK